MPTQSFRCKCGHEQDVITKYYSIGEPLKGTVCEICGGVLIKVFTPPEGTSIRGCSTPGPRT
jgi:predicted nucleic acid-binding Zn ribbon protein